MTINISELFSEQVTVLGGIHPQSTTTAQSLAAYVDIAKYHKVAIVIHVGSLTPDLAVDVNQATSSAGAGAKDLDTTNKNFTILAAQDNTYHVVEIDASEFDTANSFTFLGLTLTPSAGTACLIEATIYGLTGRYQPGASLGGFTSVKQ